MSFKITKRKMCQISLCVIRYDFHWCFHDMRNLNTYLSYQSSDNFLVKLCGEITASISRTILSIILTT